MYSYSNILKPKTVIYRLLLPIGLIQKLQNAKLLNINMTQSPDRHTHVRAPIKGYIILMFKSFTVHNFELSTR